MGGSGLMVIHFRPRRYEDTSFFSVRFQVCKYCFLESRLGVLPRSKLRTVGIFAGPSHASSFLMSVLLGWRIHTLTLLRMRSIFFCGFLSVFYSIHRHRRKEEPSFGRPVCSTARPEKRGVNEQRL